MFNPAYAHASTASLGQHIELVEDLSPHGPLGHVEGRERSTPPSAGRPPPGGAATVTGEAGTDPNRARTAPEQHPHPSGGRRASLLEEVDGSPQIADLTPRLSAGQDTRTPQAHGNDGRTSVREAPVCRQGRPGSGR